MTNYLAEIAAMTHFPLNPEEDYGFTVFRAKNTQNLPEWDLFRLRKVMEIFETCENVIDFGGATRGLSELLYGYAHGKIKTVDIDPSIAPDVVADICNLPFEGAGRKPNFLGHAINRRFHTVPIASDRRSAIGAGDDKKS